MATMDKNLAMYYYAGIKISLMQSGRTYLLCNHLEIIDKNFTNESR